MPFIFKYFVFIGALFLVAPIQFAQALSCQGILSQIIRPPLFQLEGASPFKISMARGLGLIDDSGRRFVKWLPRGGRARAVMLLDPARTKTSITDKVPNPAGILHLIDDFEKKFADHFQELAVKYGTTSEVLVRGYLEHSKVPIPQAFDLIERFSRDELTAIMDLWGQPSDLFFRYLFTFGPHDPKQLKYYAKDILQASQVLGAKNRINLTEVRGINTILEVVNADEQAVKEALTHADVSMPQIFLNRLTMAKVSLPNFFDEVASLSAGPQLIATFYEQTLKELRLLTQVGAGDLVNTSSALIVRVFKIILSTPKRVIQDIRLRSVATVALTTTIFMNVFLDGLIYATTDVLRYGVQWQTLMANTLSFALIEVLLTVKGASNFAVHFAKHSAKTSGQELTSFNQQVINIATHQHKKLKALEHVWQFTKDTATAAPSLFIYSSSATFAINYLLAISMDQDSDTAFKGALFSALIIGSFIAHNSNIRYQLLNRLITKMRGNSDYFKNHPAQLTAAVPAILGANMVGASGLYLWWESLFMNRNETVTKNETP